MRHCIIPDVQAKAGVPLDHLSFAGQYIAEKKPEVIICLGDFADMPSLSSYDVGKKSFEGRNYIQDIKAAHTAMNILMTPIHNAMKKDKSWKPRLVLTLGNHEERIERAIENDRKLEGLISTNDLKYEDWGWEVIPFLEVKVIDNVAYSHYFTSGVMGRPVASAKALTTKKHMSCIMGHHQSTELDMSSIRADGKPIISMFAGCYYQHDEAYMGPQGNTGHRQIWMLHEVKDGFFYPMAVSLNYLKQKYRKTK